MTNEDAKAIALLAGHALMACKFHRAISIMYGPGKAEEEHAAVVSMRELEKNVAAVLGGEEIEAFLQRAKTWGKKAQNDT